MVKTRMTTLAPSAASPLKTGLQTLTLTGLRFDANLGILAHEKIAPQPIQVDAELNLGQQPLGALRQMAGLLQHGVAHLSIAENMVFLQPLQLDIPGRPHPFPNN